jgi:hypothetical protein
MQGKVPVNKMGTIDESIQKVTLDLRGPLRSYYQGISERTGWSLSHLCRRVVEFVAENELILVTGENGESEEADA